MLVNVARTEKARIGPLWSNARPTSPSTPAAAQLELQHVAYAAWQQLTSESADTSGVILTLQDGLDALDVDTDAPGEAEVAAAAQAEDRTPAAASAGCISSSNSKDGA